jgi:hypothetical protein
MTVYSVGTNVPGYMPDGDSVFRTTDWDRARDALVEELDRDRSDREESAELVADPDEARILREMAQELDEVAGEVATVGPGDVARVVCGRSYWIMMDEAREPEEVVAVVAGYDIDDVSEGYGEGVYEVGSEEWLCVTDDEADELVEDAVRESLWAFKPSFLLDYLPDGMTEEALGAIQGLYEDANDPLLAMIGGDVSELAADAVGLDGRGHFLSGYDGEEREYGKWFLYRVN